jgi:hypothetical protein
MQRTLVASAPGLHLPLRNLALCLDCDECFALGYADCPACGSRTWTPAARFLELVSEAGAPRVKEGSRKASSRRAAEDLALAKHLLIVASHRRELYEQVKRAFAGHESVEVILDRRAGERRQRKGAPALEKRRRDRRSRSVIDEQLRTIGWSLVLLDLAKSKRG